MAYLCFFTVFPQTGFLGSEVFFTVVNDHLNGGYQADSKSVFFFFLL